MSYAEAIAALNDQWAQGDMDSDEYEIERLGIEYAAEQAASARDEAMGVTA